jgi:nitrogen fixation protein NifU and related proteins
METNVPAIQAIAEKKAFFGELPQANAYATAKAAHCSDLAGIQLQVSDGRIENISYISYGCGYSLAAHSIVCELAKGLSLEQARALKPAAIEEKVGGFPESKQHYCEGAVKLLQDAIANYEQSTGKQDAKFDKDREVKCGWND